MPSERRVYTTETFTNREEVRPGSAGREAGLAVFVNESRDGLGRTKQEPESRDYKEVLAACLRGIYTCRSELLGNVY